MATKRSAVLEAKEVSCALCGEAYLILRPARER